MYTEWIEERKKLSRLRAETWVRERNKGKDEFFHKKILEKEEWLVINLSAVSHGNVRNKKCPRRNGFYNKYSIIVLRFHIHHVEVDEAQTRYRLKKEAMEEKHKLEWASGE